MWPYFINLVNFLLALKLSLIVDSLSVEGGEAVVLMFSLVSVQRKENVDGGCWVFPVLDFVISLFNMFFCILPRPHCRVYTVFFFIYNLFFILQVFDMG